VWDAKTSTCGFSSPIIYEPLFIPAVAGLAAAFDQEEQKRKASEIAAQNPAGPQVPKSDSATGNDGSGVSSSAPTSPFNTNTNNNSNDSGKVSTGDGLNLVNQSGANSKLPMFLGGAVGMMALAGIAVLAVHRAKKAKEEQRQLDRHPVVGDRPIFKRQSFLPGVQRALGNVASVQPAYVRNGV